MLWYILASLYFVHCTKPSFAELVTLVEIPGRSSQGGDVNDHRFYALHAFCFSGMSGICSNIEAWANQLPFFSSKYFKLQTYSGRGKNNSAHYILDWFPPVCGLLLLHKQSQMSRLMTSKAAMVGSSITSTEPGTLHFLPASVVNWYRCIQCKKTSGRVELRGCLLQELIVSYIKLVKLKLTLAHWYKRVNA